MSPRMNELDHTIRDLRERQVSRSRLMKRMALAEEHLRASRSRLKRANAKLEEEQADVDRLEGLSLTALFHTVLFSKADQLDRERQEALRAELARDERRAAVRKLEATTDRLRAEVASLGDPDAELERALTAKEDLMQLGNSPEASRLAGLAQERANALVDLNQINEARAEGDHALDSLESLIESLSSAGAWGTWDVIGGGLVATAVKHSHINASREHAAEAQADLRSFERELQDVRLDAALEVQIDGFLTFADYFFDGLISDWVVQMKIKGSRDEAVKVRQQVAATLKALDERATATEKGIAALEKERRDLL